MQACEPAPIAAPHSPRLDPRPATPGTAASPAAPTVSAAPAAAATAADAAAGPAYTPETTTAITAGTAGYQNRYTGIADPSTSATATPDCTQQWIGTSSLGTRQHEESIPSAFWMPRTAGN